MFKRIFIIGLIAITGGMFTASAQTADNLKPSVATGDVVSVTDTKIVLNTKDGAVDVLLTAKTEYKRVAPDKPSLKNAVASAFSDIGTGDKLLVTGFFSADKKSIPANAIYLMTKSDIAQKNAKESSEWSTRGISGRVASVNAETKQITVEVRGLGQATSVVLTPKPEAKFRRYAPNSTKYSEAQTSSFSDLKAGDMLRALGDKSTDGTSFAAEELISGAFRTIAGSVKSVDAEKNEIVISDLSSKKDVTVSLGSASVLKKFPEEMAQRMAAAQAGGMRPAGQGTGTPPATGAQTPAPEGGRGGMGGGQRAGGIDDMLERFPNITTADIKVGDMIAVSSSKGPDDMHITAIKLLAGVEPFIKAAQASTSNGGRRGQGGQGGGFTIPGLDGFDVP